ncbi:MAG: integrase core domain-containing protein, partial [Beijerinckiaceae bacterium]
SFVRIPASCSARMAMICSSVNRLLRMAHLQWMNRTYHWREARGAGQRRPHHHNGLVHHSDRGSQYVSIRYSERLAEAGIEPSVGSIGDTYDNALAETINGLYKAEVIHRCGPWRSFEAVEFATLEWVDWYNHRRLMRPIGDIPPAEAEERYYAMLDQPAMAA